jgi:quercetin dioxygenase-like cupin family protein
MDLPRVLCDTSAVVSGAPPDAAGALWRLQEAQRDLDANLVQLPSGATVDAHAGPEVDVLLYVVHGTGLPPTERDRLDLRAGVLVWLPRRSRREIRAGADGLRYLTAHVRRAGITVQPPS